MRLFLSSEVFLAVREEDLVILDAARGEYLLLSGAGAGLTVGSGSNLVTGATAPLAEALADAGLLAPADQPLVRTGLPPPPRRDLGPALGPAPRARDLLRWSLAAGDMVGTYWRKPFGALVAAHQAAPAYGGTPEALAAHAVLVRRLMPWVPFQGVCLFRSAMLRAYLRRARLSATWVFGVRTWPFEAHCWLQVDDLVLDDTTDHAASFTPLMAIA